MATRNGCLTLGRLIAFVPCVAVSAFITIIQPVSRVSFERHGDRVTAQAHILLFFVLPFRSKTVDPVVEIDGRRAGSQLVYKRSGPPTRTEEEGFLVIRGRGQTMEVAISPKKLDGVKQRAAEFLSNADATELKMTLVASWFASAIGGAFSLVALFIVIGVLSAIARFLWHFVSPRTVNVRLD